MPFCIDFANSVKLLPAGLKSNKIIIKERRAHFSPSREIFASRHRSHQAAKHNPSRYCLALPR